MPRLKKLSMSLALFSALTAISIAAPAPDEQIVYKEVEGEDLTLHVFKPEGWKASGSRPAIVFFFGGGWVGGTPSQFYPHCEHLAGLGMVAISAQYRTKKSHGTDPFTCVEDGKSAIRAVRARAKEFGVNPEKIAAGGGSAGGHVAASTGTLKGFEVGDTKVSSMPQAMVLFNPVCDTSADGFGHKKLGKRWREISPLHGITAKTPPTCIFHGTADTTVPFKNAADFAKAMMAKERKCELHAYEGEKHGFFNEGRGDGKAYPETLAQMDAFLRAEGFIPAKKD